MKDNNHMPSGRMRAIWLLRWVDPSFFSRYNLRMSAMSNL